MWDRLQNGWQLGMQSLQVLRENKKLLVFPLLSGLACILVLASFALPLWNNPQLRGVFDQGKGAQDPLVYVLAFAFYFANYFVIIFFNAALVACVIVRFHGGEPTLSDGLGAAMSRLPQILAWALVSATVGVVLKLIEDRSERVGQFVAGLLGMAWGAVTYFVVPVLVVERVGPVEAFKRSCAIVRKAWGESLAAKFSIGLVVLVFFLLALIPMVLGLIVGGVVFFVGLAVTALLLLVVALVSSALHVIAVAALYEFAAHQVAPQPFDERLLRGAFVPK